MIHTLFEFKKTPTVSLGEKKGILLSISLQQKEGRICVLGAGEEEPGKHRKLKALGCYNCFLIRGWQKSATICVLGGMD